MSWESLKKTVKHDPVIRGASEVGKAVSKGVKTVGRLGAAISRVTKVAGSGLKQTGRNVGAAIKHEANPYAAGVKKSEALLASKTKRAGYKAREQRDIDAADAEKAYTKKGWHESKEGQAAFARHKNLMKNGDAAQRTARATGRLVAEDRTVVPKEYYDKKPNKELSPLFKALKKK